MPQVAQKLVANGVTFLRGEVTQSLCCPSRASILTGQYTRHHGVNNLDGALLDDSATLATWLDAAGYRTGLVGKYLNGYGAGSLANYIPPGWDSFHSFHGYTNQDNPYTDYPWINWESGGAMEVTRYNNVDSTSTAACAAGNLYSTDLICKQSKDFLAADTTTPFFLYVNPASPHSPQTVAARHQGIYTGLAIPTYPSHNVIPSPNPPAYLPATPLNANQMNRNLANFRLALEQNRAVDDMVGSLYDQLAADGRLANTVWVFISDNGGGTGEHRLTGKQCPYLECHRVPFIVVCPTGICPGAANGTRDATNYALNIDIAPTIVDLAGATATIRMDGRSLVPILSNPTTPWRTEWGLYDLDAPIDGVVAKASTGQWYKYLVGRDTGHVQLYNLTTDPWELTNLWNNTAYTAIQADMAAKLANFLSNPTLTITQQPPSSGAGTSATFAYSSNETVTFECSLDGGAASACGTGTTGTITYTGLSAATHTVKIQAVDAYGNASPVSTITFALTGGGGGDTEAPTAPAGLAATSVTHAAVSLSWGASTDDVGVTHYAVARDGVDIATPTGTSYTDTTVSPSTDVLLRRASGGRRRQPVAGVERDLRDHAGHPAFGYGAADGVDHRPDRRGDGVGHHHGVDDRLRQRGGGVGAGQGRRHHRRHRHHRPLQPRLEHHHRHQRIPHPHRGGHRHRRQHRHLHRGHGDGEQHRAHRAVHRRPQPGDHRAGDHLHRHPHRQPPPHHHLRRRHPSLRQIQDVHQDLHHRRHLHRHPGDHQRHHRSPRHPHPHHHHHHRRHRHQPAALNAGTNGRRRAMRPPLPKYPDAPVRVR